MIIKNGLVWEESGSFRKKELVVDTTTHRIAETAEDDTVFDAEGLYVIPGLVDVHIHGARGHDFSDGKFQRTCRNRTISAFLRCDFILPDFHDPAGSTAYSCLCDD